MREQRCETCRWMDRGTCRNQPPVVFPVGGVAGPLSYWPPVEGWDWCGQWAPVPMGTDENKAPTNGMEAAIRRWHVEMAEVCNGVRIGEVPDEHERWENAWKDGILYAARKLRQMLAAAK